MSKYDGIKAQRLDQPDGSKIYFCWVRDGKQIKPLAKPHRTATAAEEYGYRTIQRLTAARLYHDLEERRTKAIAAFQAEIDQLTELEALDDPAPTA